MTVWMTFLIGSLLLVLLLLETCVVSFAQQENEAYAGYIDAMALSYGDTNEVKKIVSMKKHKSIESNKKSFRQLAEGQGDKLLATRTFPECIEQSLSPEECQSFIQTQIDNAGGHEVGGVIVKIQTPRTPEQLAESYWMVEVPVNLYNKMTCDRNDGKTFYPFKWMDDATGSPLDVEDQDCSSLSAGECCLKLRYYGKQVTTSGYDANKQCLSCFVHQEPLEPVLNEANGETDYLECKDLESGDCVQEQLTGADVDALDLQTVERIETAIASLESFQTNRSCDKVDQLLEELYNAAVIIPPLSIKIGRLACTICYGMFDLQLEDDMVTFQLAEILMMMKKHSPPAKSIDSKENCIIIYTNADGEVVKHPTLGGSWSYMTSKRNVSPHVPPAPTPTTVPTGDNDSRRDCQNDSDCDDTEWCEPVERNCIENRCITDPPDDCQGERNLRCEPSTNASKDFYSCVEIDCNIDPSICSENEYCRSEFEHYPNKKKGPYRCEVYKNPGDDCGLRSLSWEDGDYVFDGECKPDVSFCLDPNLCFGMNQPFNDSFFSRKCIAYGEGSCLDETTGEITQAKCKKDEYCDNVNERCKPNRNKGECCSPSLNNCGYETELGTLICAPNYNYVGFDNERNDFFICQKICYTDDDCGNNEWCAPVDEQHDPPIYPGKFCKEYKSLDEHCGRIKSDDWYYAYVHAEERCDPSNSYCYNPKFCLALSDYYFESQCRSYGNECKSDADCVDAATEWCDTDIGYCKDRINFLECCTTVGDESKNDCPSTASSCELLPPVEETWTYSFNVYKGEFYTFGAAICTEGSL